MEPRRETIDGVVYELRAWSIADGQAWYFRLIALIGRVGVIGGADENFSLAVMLSMFDERTYADLWRTCRKYSYRIGEEAGSETVALIEGLETKKDPVAIPYLAILMLSRFHLEAEYSSFFARLPALLQAGKDGSGSKSPPD